jgi:hypothetical protein
MYFKGNYREGKIILERGCLTSIVEEAIDSKRL